MRKGTINTSFAVVQWHGHDYPYYKSDAMRGEFKEGDEVLVLHEATPNKMGKVFVVFCERTQTATTIAEAYLTLSE